VACYYFPNWGPKGESEWGVLQAAKPKFEGHIQPKVPLWGYQNEQDPAVMAQKIDAAADSGIDSFIFDWYWYDTGSKFGKALENGFLKAPNNNRIKFAVMWCNHDDGPNHPGAVARATFETITDYVIKNYFTHPSYWKIDGCPYFSIYQFFSLVETFGGSIPETTAALERFRQKTKAAGFPDLHLNVVCWGVRPEGLLTRNPGLQVDSLTSYVWVHHISVPDFPATQYQILADAYFQTLYNGGAGNGLQQPAINFSVPYHPNVTMGWDPSPRCDQSAPWTQDKPYPYGAVLVGNTPQAFKNALLQAVKFVDASPHKQKIITIDAWNEWTEGSYLEPDTVNGMKYLQAIKEVFRR
jgi:hypothetical protein